MPLGYVKEYNCLLISLTGLWLYTPIITIVDLAYNYGGNRN